MSAGTTHPGPGSRSLTTASSASAVPGTRARLSVLWVFVMLNYLYCDLMGLMDPESLKQFLTGDVNGIHITQGFLLGSAVLMELPIVMVAASVFLPHRLNRWANMAAGTLMTLVQLGSLFLGSLTAFYAFFSVVEVACTCFIVWYAWRWGRA